MIHIVEEKLQKDARLIGNITCTESVAVSEKWKDLRAKGIQFLVKAVHSPGVDLSQDIGISDQPVHSHGQRHLIEFAVDFVGTEDIVEIF